MKRTFFVVLILTAVIGLTGCNVGKDLDAAKSVGQAYYEAVQIKDFEAAMGYYSPEFFEETSRSDTLKALETITTKLGDLQSFNLTGWRVNSYAGTGGSHTSYNLTYQTTYVKGSAEETLTFVKSEDSSKMLILGFYVDSPALLIN